MVVCEIGSIAPVTRAQRLNWEGQTGAFLTLFAHATASSAHGFESPSVSFHDLNGGDVIGGLYQISATVRFLKRFEAVYTRALNSVGNTPGPRPLFEDGFNTFPGKANFVAENAGKHNYLPALSAGFILRPQVHHVGGVIAGKNTTNGDADLVATKTITQIKSPSIVANLGIKATNALAFGIAGNAPPGKAGFSELWGLSCP